MMRAHLLAALLIGATAPLAAQTTTPRADLTPGSTVTITPGRQYQAGGLHRLFFGTHYRDLWATPIKVQVLDLATFDGGLTPTRTGGGKQTKSLRFKSKDGREYATFGLEARSSGGKLEWEQHCPDGNSSSPQCARGKFSFHGTVAAGSYVQGSRGQRCRSWSGTGTSKQIGSASVTVQACDDGEPGRGTDYIEVTISNYQNAGYLTGGNIQLHEERP